MRFGSAASARQPLTLRDCSAEQSPMRSGSTASTSQLLTLKDCSAEQSPMRSGSVASAPQPLTLKGLQRRAVADALRQRRQRIAAADVEGTAAPSSRRCAPATPPARSRR